MARLPSALKRKDQDWAQAAKLRQENLARLNGAARGNAPEPVQQQVQVDQPDPAEEAPALVSTPAVVEPAHLGRAPESDGELERLKSRLATTEGMHRADNERNRTALEEAQAREAELKRRLETMERQQPAAPMSLDELKRYVTAQQLAEFGEEQCRLLVAAARTAAGELSRAAVQAEVSEVRKELAEQRAQSQRQREAGFWTVVNGALPRWREVNANAQFLSWLGERDALSGRVRQAMLDEARAALDAERVIAIFNAWEQSQPKPPAARDPSRRVIPNGRAPAAIPTDQPAENIVARAWIAEQNRLHSQGYYRRRPTEWAAVQETIDKAAREGRIR